MKNLAKWASLALVITLTSTSNAFSCDTSALEVQVMTDDLSALRTQVDQCSQQQLGQTDVVGENLLFTAIRYESNLALSYLLDQGLSPNQLNNDSQTPLFYVSNTQQARELLNAGVKLGQIDNRGQSAFSVLLENKNWNLLKNLLSQGAEIQVRDYQWAADYYHLDVLNFLADNTLKAELQGSGKYFRSFFFYEKEYRDVAAKLVAKGADLNRARLISSRRGLLDSYVDDYVKNNTQYQRHGDVAIEWLVKNGADVNAYVPRAGKSVAQHMLSRTNEEKAIKFLGLFIEAGLNLNQLSGEKTLLMDLASAYRKDESKDDYLSTMIKKIIDFGANVNVQNEQGRTALHWAIRWENPIAAKVLLEANADLTLQDNNGLTALEYALERLERMPSHVNKKALAQIIKMLKK